MAFGDLKAGFGRDGGATANPQVITITATAVAVGDLVFVGHSQNGNLTVTSVTDNLGNSYTATSAGIDAGNITARCFYSRVTNPGSLTTFNLATTASSQAWFCTIVAIGGPFATSPLDANPAEFVNTDLTSPLTCPATGVLAQADEVIIARATRSGIDDMFVVAPLLLGVTSFRANEATVGYQVVSSTASVTPSFTTAVNPTSSILSTHSFRKAPSITGSLSATETGDDTAAFTGSVEVAPGDWPYTAWDAANKSDNVTLSNGDLTATGNNGGAGNGNVLGLDGYATGKRYFAVEITALNNNTFVGFSDEDFVLGNYLLDNPDSIGWIVWGDIAYNNNWYTSISFAAGDILHFAIDIDNDLAWFRLNAGNWNNSGTADPATGVEGFAASLNGIVKPNFGVSFNDGGGATFSQQTPPSGFTWFGDDLAVEDITGSLAATETGSDTAAFTGAVPISGALAAIETGSDALSASLSAIVGAALSSTELGSDSASASLQAALAASLAASEVGSDSASFNLGQQPAIQASLAAIETGSDAAAIQAGVGTAAALRPAR